ncbi:phage tail tape measure protein [Rossellomorea vietnamensis]|uniref:phage tail tape measure protein n=1 Tax=Rossellomorea vietnamensis TaxID=218284 RepID=UPI003CF95BAC
MTERIEGISIGLGLDTIKVESGLTDLRSKMRLVNSEMKANLSAFDKGDKSLEKYQTTLTGLNKKLEVQKSITENAMKSYQKMVKEHGEGSKEAEKAAKEYNNQRAALNNLSRYIDRTTDEMKQFRKEQELSESRLVSFRDTLDKTGDTLTGVGDKMGSAGQSLSMYLTAPLVGFGVAAGKSALDFNKAAGQIQADLGVSGERAAELNKVAKELWKNGFGDSVGEAAGMVSGVTKALGELSKVDLTYVSQGLDLFESRGWGDQRETLRAMKVLMEQFGMSSQAAMDYLTKGFQENLNYSDEFLDTVSEYSTYFAELGFTSDDMFAKLKSGAETGAFQLDKVGDSMKEFSLRAKDGSKSSTEAFESLGLNADKMTSEFNKGGDTAKKAFEKVIRSLQDTEDETLRNTASTGLFGTQYEDLGEKAFDAMLEASKGLENVEGATKKASDALYDNFGDRATVIWRDFLSDMEPVGQQLLDIAEDILPKVADTIEGVTDSFNDLSPAGKDAALMVGGIAVAAGPTLTAVGALSTGLGAVTKVTSPLLALLGEKTGLTGILTRIPGPVGLVAGGLALATTAVIGIKEATEKANEVNLKHTDSLINQQKELETSVGKYEALREKFELNNYELGRYLDLQDKVKIATDPAAIEEYKNKMDALQIKSGLTNDEFAEFLSLDESIRENAPESTTKVTEYGNAFLDLSEDLQPVLNKQREFINNQLEIEKDKAYENLKEVTGDYLETQEKLNTLIQRHNESVVEQYVLRQNAKALEDEIRAAEEAGDAVKVENLERRKLGYEEEANQLQATIDRQYEGFAIEQDRLGGLQSRIVEESKVYDQLIQQELKMQDLNGTSSEAIGLVDSKIAKLREEKSSLDANYRNGQLTNAEYQEQNSKLMDQIGVLKDSRGRITDIKNEQNEVTGELLNQIEKGATLNQILDEDHVKDVDIKDYGKAAKLQREVEKDAKKSVDVSDHGDNVRIQRDAEKSARKGIKFFGKNSVYDLLPNIVTVSVKFAGKLLGIGNNADGTRNWRGGLTWVGEEGPELMHLPKGAKVIPNEDSMSLLKKWNIPITERGFATGGQVNTAGLYPLAEEGRPEYVITTNPSRKTDAMKLLALAGRAISGNKQPFQLPDVSKNDDATLNQLLEATLQQNSILMRILQKENPHHQGMNFRALARELYEPLEEIRGRNF